MAQFVDTIVPEGARPTVRALLKHHFWILAGLVPLVLLPLLFSGSGAIGTQIEARRQEIDGKISQVKQVSQVVPHPNEEWSKAIGGQAQTVQQEINDEWTRLWESQKSLRAWPPELGVDFLRTIERLRGNDQLPRALLQRYQTAVPQLARKLPELMGVPAADVGLAPDAAAGAGGFVMPRPRRGMPPGPGPGAMGDGPGANPFIPAKMNWSPADQARIFQSFAWTAVPSTRQVLMAQEQLWVYGMFCELLRDFSKNATGPHDAPISIVEEIAISQDAAEPGPGGMAENRVFLPAKPRSADGGMDSMGMGSGMEMSGMGGMPSAGGRTRGRGMRPRSGSGGMGDLGGGSAPGFGGGGGRAAGGPPSDTDLLSFAYVDFGGRPLTAEKLVSEPGAEMTHLMPFVLRVVIDQRQIDALLVALAASSTPIDVRQVRINADGAAGRLGDESGMSGMMPGMPGMAGMPGMGAGALGDMGGFPGGAAGSAGLRRHDVRLELRGTVALATKPGERLTVAPDADEVGRDTTRSPVRRPVAVIHDRRQRSTGNRFGEARS